MTTSRFQRWSQKKAEARQEEVLPPLVESEIEPELSPEEQELAINEALPEEEVLAKYDLPNPDVVELGMDITGFLRKEVPELLRRRALRSLWRSNPVLAVLDGLNDYDEDYTDAAYAGKAVNTLYKVGQGMIDRTKKSIEEVIDGAPLESELASETLGSTTPAASTGFDESQSVSDQNEADNTEQTQAKSENQTDEQESSAQTQRINDESKINSPSSNPEPLINTFKGVEHFEPVPKNEKKTSLSAPTELNTTTNTTTTRYRQRMRFDF